MDTVSPVMPSLPAEVDFEQEVGHVGELLARAMRSLVGAIPGGPYRPQQLARALGLNKNVSSRVLAATGQKDPIATVHCMPGPECLRQLTRAAGRKGVDAAVVEDAESAIESFERLLLAAGGDRAALDAIIGGWLPDARQRFETAAKQMMFKGTASLKGVMTETELSATFIHPTSSSNNLDLLVLSGLVGVRRLRPGVPVYISVLHSRRAQLRSIAEAGRQLEDAILRPFSTPSAEIEAREAESYFYAVLRGKAVGPASAVDVFMTEFIPNGSVAFGTPERPSVWISSINEIPAKTQVNDVFVHKSVWKNIEPELRLYDTTFHGSVGPKDLHSEVRRLPITESIQALGHGAAGFRNGLVPNYVEMIRRVCDQRGWIADDFRGVRCQISYPFYGLQAAIVFQLPTKA